MKKQPTSSRIGAGLCALTIVGPSVLLSILLSVLLSVVPPIVLSVALPATSAEAEASGPTMTLPPMGEHWLWIPDRILEHSLLFDGDRGEMLGAISSPSMLTPKLPLVSRARNEIYSVDLDYARGRRGKRSDYVTIYDAETLDVTGEVVLPHPTSESNTSLHHATLLDDDRFLVVFSQFPTTVATVVDLTKREVVAEIPIAGCAGVYATGVQRFATLCGDGTIAEALLDDEGRFEQMARSDPFFNVVKDPVSMAGVRIGTSWLFISFEGLAHELSFSTDRPISKGVWPLVRDAEASEKWRPGGLQPFAVHRSSKRFYALMHQGGDGSHKAAGPEIWTFDLDSHERIARLAVPNLAAEFIGRTLEFESDSYVQRAMRIFMPSEGAHAIAVTQDASPLLFTRNAELGVVAVMDATTGEHLRNLDEIGLAGPTLGVP